MLTNCRLTADEIQEMLNRRDRKANAVSPELRRASVLIPLLCVDGEWHVLYTHRTEMVLSHKGQVAFPGGTMDPEDLNAEATALREAQEEIGLNPANVRILGSLDEYSTISYYRITPVVAHILNPFDYILSEDEVMRVFTVPLMWLADRSHWEVRPFLRPSGQMEPVVYFQQYDGELVWGITARITLEFLKAIGLYHE